MSLDAQTPDRRRAGQPQPFGLRPPVARRLLPAVGLLALGAFVGNAGASPLVNGDFGAGFNGWSGQVIACDDASCATETTTAVGSGAGQMPFASLPNNYGVVSGTATLTTSFATDLVYDVLLTQVFDVDSIISGASGLALDYVLGINLSNPTDIATAFLSTTDGALTVQLLPGTGRLDITAFAGREAQLTFGLTDFDGAADSLSIGGLVIEQVPVPATALLLLTGLGLVAHRRAQTPRPARTAC